MRKTIVMAALLIPGIMVAGCGKSASQAVSEKVVEKSVEAALKKDGKEGNVKIDGDKMTMTVKENGKDTSVSVGEGSKIPADFPKDIPLPTGFAPNVSMGQAAEQTFTLSGTAAGTLDSVGAEYRKNAVAQGWKETMNFNQAGEMQTVQFEKDARVLNFVVQKADKGVTVSLTTAKK